MRILIKYTIKSMMEKKFRSFLIILAIALAGGLFLASSRLTSNIADMYSNLITEAVGKSDIRIMPNEKSPTRYMSISGCNEFQDEIERVVPYLGGGAEYKAPGSNTTEYIDIQGYNLEDYLAINKLSILEGSVDDFTGAKIILSKNGASKLGVSVGDELSLNINGMRKILVAAIADTKGAFKGEEGYFMGIMPFDTISQYSKTNGRASMIHIKVKQSADKEKVIADLQKVYPKYDVEETFNKEELENNLSSLTAPFMLMTFIVVFMSMFIIYSSFKVIMLEKLPIVGTFRSVGASKGIMNGVLLLEALFYGIIGGIAACGFGVGALYILSALMISAFVNGGPQVDISVAVPMSSYIGAFLMGLIMALVSTILPILSVSKISLKDIILNNRPHKRSKYLRGTIIGILLIIGGFILAKVVKEDLAMLSSMAGLFMVIMGIVKILPAAVLYVSQVIGLAFRVLFGNIGELATKNIKKNKSVLNSITLITIGISILFSISTMTRNVSDQVLDFYKDTFKCDILGYIQELNDQKIRIIKRNENVTNVIETIGLYIESPEFNNTEIYPEAIQTTQLSPHLKYNLKGDEKALLEELQEGRNIIITEFLRNKYKVQLGDMITFKFDNDVTKPYKVIGFMNTEWENGRFALMPLKYVKKDANKKFYDSAYITVKDGIDPEEVVQQLQESFAQIAYTNLRTVKTQTEMNQENNAGLMGMISIFAILAMVIGVVGVINNLMISFIERKQNIAMLRSVGMSKLQVLKMIFVEGLGSGIISATGGLIGGIVTTYILNYVLQAMDQMIVMTIVPELFTGYFIGGMMITVIGSIIPARGSSKLNIIEAIKYE